MKFLVQNNILLDSLEQPCDEAILGTVYKKRQTEIGRVSFLETLPWYTSLESDIATNPDNYETVDKSLYVTEMVEKSSWLINVDGDELIEFIKKYKNCKIVNINKKFDGVKYKIII